MPKAKKQEPQLGIKTVNIPSESEYVSKLCTVTWARCMWSVAALVWLKANLIPKATCLFLENRNAHSMVNEAESGNT